MQNLEDRIQYRAPTTPCIDLLRHDSGHLIFYHLITIYNIFVVNITAEFTLASRRSPSVILTARDLDANRHFVRSLGQSIFSQIELPSFESTLFASVVSTSDFHSVAFPRGPVGCSDSSKAFYHRRGERECAVGL